MEVGPSGGREGSLSGDHNKPDPKGDCRFLFVTVSLGSITVLPGIQRQMLYPSLFLSFASIFLLILVLQSGQSSRVWVGKHMTTAESREGRLGLLCMKVMVLLGTYLHKQ